jgi:outer membrane protein
MGGTPPGSNRPVGRPGTRRAEGATLKPRVKEDLLNIGRRISGMIVTGLVVALVPGPATAQTVSGTPRDTVHALSIEDALRMALDRNRDLHAARLSVHEADGRVAEARSGVLPRVDLNASYTRNITPPASFMPARFFDPDAGPDELTRVSFGGENVWSSTLTFEQPLFEGRAFAGVGAAGRYRALQEETFRGQVLDVMTRIRLLYYQLLLAREQARLIERSVDRVVQSLDETRALHRAGVAADYDVLRLEVELANLEPQLRRVVNDARAGERELVTALDLGEGTRIEVVGDLAQLDLEDPAANDPGNQTLLSLMGAAPPTSDDEAAVDELLQRARDGSSELAQLELAEDVQSAELRVEQAAYLPRVSVFGSYQVHAQQDGRPDFFGQSGLRGYGRLAGVQVSVPVFTGLQRGARVQQKQAAIRQTRTQREVAADRIRDRVRTVLEEAEDARLRVRGQRLAVAQARRGFEIASSQYREGLGSQLELTDAEVALRQSEFNYAEAVFDYLSSRARLDALLGQVPLPSGSWGVR